MNTYVNSPYQIYHSSVNIPRDMLYYTNVFTTMYKHTSKRYLQLTAS